MCFLHLFLVFEICLVKIFFSPSGFQIYILAAFSHHNEPQQPTDGLHHQNTLALQQTGERDTSVSVFIHLFVVSALLISACL